MKPKKLRERLERAQKWWDSQPQSFKNATTRPGGINQRIVTGK